MQRRMFLGTVLGGAAGGSLPAQSPASAQGLNPRTRLNFNADWRFQRQSSGGGALGSWDRDSDLGSTVEPRFRQAMAPDFDDTPWDPIFLPHTWNAHDSVDEVAGYFRGIGWYRKHFTIPASLRGQRVFLEFEGTNQTAEVWVNGLLLGSHTGGYTGFEFDITGALRYGAAGNVVTVKVDNLYSPNVAPTVKTDVTFYGGIYRDVWLRTSNPQYARTVHWRTPRVSGDSAELEIHSVLTNSADRGASLELLHEVIDPSGLVVAACRKAVVLQAMDHKHAERQTTGVAKPALWSPDSPILYRIRTTLLEGSKPVDVSEIPLGFRFFHFDANQGFFLNGKRLQLRGTTWHQSYPGMGNALPNSRHVKDMECIRDMGCNLFRTSHYPHDPAVMEACDRLGLLVIDEIFVGEEVDDSPAYFAVQSKTIAEMVERDRNHPSVIMWGFGGEVESPQKSVNTVRALVLEYKKLDPSRPATMHDPRVEGVKEVLDVVGLYSTFDQDDRDHVTFPHRKYLIQEYTAAPIGRGIYGMTPESEDLGCENHEKYLSEVNKRPWIAGSVLWHQFDYDGEEYDTIVPHLVTFGMADAWRIPKDVFYFYKSQWSDKPVVHICGHWTWPGEESKSRPVKVYSNQDQVELFLNGRSLGQKSRIRGQALDHPPRIWEVPYEPGTLRAVSPALSCERKSAGVPARIQLQTDADQIASGDRESLAYITACIVDKHGVVVPSAFHPIAFTSYGPGELLPQTWPGYPTGITWNAVAGITGIALRATARVGRCIVSAYSPGLAVGRVEINVVASGKRDQMEYRGGAVIYK